MTDEKPKSGIFSSLFLMYLILVLHGLVIVLFALLVVFFRGVVSYLPWIMLGGGLLVILSGWLIWRKFINSQRQLREFLESPLLRDREVEVKLLGGMASVKLGAPVTLAGPQHEALEHRPVPALAEPDPQRPRVEEPFNQRVVEIETEAEPVAVPETPPVSDAEAARLTQLARLIKRRENGELSEAEYLEQKRELTGSPASETSVH